MPIIVFSSLLLMGCSQSEPAPSSTSILPVSTSEITVQPTSQVTSDVTSETTSEVTSEVSSTSVPIQTETSTIATAGAVWSSKWSPGTQFAEGSNPTNLKNWLNEQAETTEPLFSELECVKIASQTSEKDTADANHLTLGSAKAAGSLTLRSYSVFVGIKLVVSQYYSYNSYSGWTNDPNSVLVVNGVDYNVPLVESGAAQSKEIEITLSEPAHFFTIGSKNDTNGRVFVDSISVTYMI